MHCDQEDGGLPAMSHEPGNMAMADAWSRHPGHFFIRLDPAYRSGWLEARLEEVLDQLAVVGARRGLAQNTELMPT